MQSKQLIKGTIKTIILKLLEENGKMYGYEITQYVKARTEGRLVLTEAALYPALHQMEAKGLLTTEKVKVNNRVRKYYSLTPTGAKASADRLEDFYEFVKIMQLLLQPKMT